MGYGGPLADFKPVAVRKLARLVAEGAPLVDVSGAETYAEAAERIRASRRSEGVADVGNEEGRDRLHILPHIGAMLVTAVRPAHVRSVLEAARDAGKSQQTVRHIRRTMNAVFAAMWRDEAIPDNPVARVQVPKSKQDRRERAVLSDEELIRYLGWQHPDQRHALGVLERQTMGTIARVFGGLRAGDLHALRWEALETEDGRFSFGWAPRKKTARPQLLEVPEMLRPILFDWWERAGKPKEGLLFPSLRGKQAGTGEKSGVSHAAALRKDLRRAFGLERWSRTAQRWEPVPDRALTPRERELLEGTDTVKPVDFHSWRRAYNQALADAGLSAQQASALAGHADLGAHARYLNNTAKMRCVPLAALPKLAVHRTVLARPMPKLGALDQETSAPEWIRTTDLRLRRPALYPAELRALT